MKLYQNNCVPLCIQRVSIMPRQVRKASNDGYYQGYNLSMTYVGNMLTSVRDDATRHSYAGATDFDGVTGREYPLTYNDAGSLVSDAGRKIARIDYDYLNNPVRIQFTNGNVTKYVYSATGEKLRVTYQTAVPNITVAIGSSRELAPSEIQCTDYTDYLLGGTLTLKNGRIDKYQFDEGYCYAEKYIYNTSQDDFTFCYYDQNHVKYLLLISVFFFVCCTSYDYKIERMPYIELSYEELPLDVQKHLASKTSFSRFSIDLDTDIVLIDSNDSATYQLEYVETWDHGVGSNDHFSR